MAHARIEDVHTTFDGRVTFKATVAFDGGFADVTIRDLDRSSVREDGSAILEGFRRLGNALAGIAGDPATIMWEP
jgi:hypothetical protein